MRHLADLAIVLLPLLRPLRLLRLVVLIGVMQKAVGNAIRGKVILYTISGAVLLVYVASLAVLQAERNAPKPTSSISAMPCGGPSPRSPQSATATCIR